MNPPYQVQSTSQQNRIGGTQLANAIYHKFIELAIDRLSPDYIISVNPSRWMTGGMGLTDFRNRMKKDKRIKFIKHFPGEDEVFENVSIKGGVNYFLWDKNYNGDCEFISGNTRITRSLDEYDIIIQDNNALPILKKVIEKSKKWIKQKCFGNKPFELATNFDNWKEVGVPCYSILNKITFVNEGDFVDKNNILKKWKAVTSKAGSPNKNNKGEKVVISNIFIIEPDSICTETYIVVNVFDTKNEAENFTEYMKTKFFRFMLGLRALTQDIYRDKFKWVPDLEDYSKKWTDVELYEKYNLSQEERDYIEAKIKGL